MLKVKKGITVLDNRTPIRVTPLRQSSSDTFNPDSGADIKVQTESGQLINKGILVVYNTCTVANIAHDGWNHDLNSIIAQSQNFDNFNVVVSECRGTNEDLDDNPDIKSFMEVICKNGYYYNVIREQLSPFATFNHTVMEMVKKLGQYEYYMYVSSGISFPKDDIFKTMYEWLSSNKDVARANLPIEGIDNHYPPLHLYARGQFSDEMIPGIKGMPIWKSRDYSGVFTDVILSKMEFTMPPGYYVNDHCSIFSNDMYNAYDGRMRPDMWLNNGSEGIYSYLTSAIGKRNVVLPTYACPALHHNARQDGNTAGTDNKAFTGGWYLLHKTKVGIHKFKTRLEENNVFLDTFGGIVKWVGRTNGNLSAEHSEILLQKFGPFGTGLDESERDDYLNFLKNELFVSNSHINYTIINSELTSGDKEMVIVKGDIKSVDHEGGSVTFHGDSVQIIAESENKQADTSKQDIIVSPPPPNPSSNTFINSRGETVNKGILIVYNTCTVTKIAKNEWWSDISSVHAQNFKDYQIVVSECRGTRKDLDGHGGLNNFIMKMLDHNHFYNIIYEQLSCPTTFNQTLMETVKLTGKWEYYMYISSGVRLATDNVHHPGTQAPPRSWLLDSNGVQYSHKDEDILGNVYKWLKENPDVGRANLAAHRDNFFPPDSKEDWPPSLGDTAFNMTAGYYINDHCSIFSNDVYEMYDGKMRPDEFISNGAEGTYSYMCNGMGKKSVILPLSIVPPMAHRGRQDGQNPGNGGDPYEWYHTHKTIDAVNDFIRSHEEHSVFLDSYHGDRDPNWHGETNGNLKPERAKVLIEKFGEDGLGLKEEERQPFIDLCKKWFFVTKEQFNYDEVNNKLITPHNSNEIFIGKPPHF